MEPLAEVVEPLAEVVPLVRPDASPARESQQQPPPLSPKGEEQQQQPPRARFAEIVRPLERKARRRLCEPQLSACYESFVAYPDGFADVVERLVARADIRLPLRILELCVEQGEPREAQELIDEEKNDAAADEPGAIVSGCTHADCRHRDRCKYA